ncbi:MAG TPA: PilZ domain-containing protein, partial [Tepidisphaeraceae bacterium]|nr:PilZ domain-containing protein [Tepidisphaeraceae bacterium]
MGSNPELLRDVIRRRSSASVDSRTAAGSCRFEVQLLSENTSANEPGIWARLIDGQVSLIDRLVSAQTPVIVSADDGRVRVSFDSVLLLRRRPLIGGDRVLVAWPAAVKAQDRRRHPRERADDAAGVTASLVRAGSHSYSGPGLPLSVLDISRGGARFLSPIGAAIKLRPQENLEIRLNIGGSEHRVCGRHCHIDTLPGGQLRFG